MFLAYDFELVRVLFFLINIEDNLLHWFYLSLPATLKLLMKRTFFIFTTLALLINGTIAFGQKKYEEPQFKFDKTKNASLKIADLTKDLELRAPGQPITIIKYSVTVTIDGDDKTFESKGSKIGTKAVDAITSAKQKPTHLDFSNVTFTQEGDNSKQVLKGFTIFLK